MPTYQYACDECGHEFEEFQSITSPPLMDCPECKAVPLRRVPQAGLPARNCWSQGVHLMSLGAPSDAQRKRLEKQGLQYDSQNRLVVHSEAELKRAQRITLGKSAAPQE